MRSSNQRCSPSQTLAETALREFSPTQPAAAELFPGLLFAVPIVYASRHDQPAKVYV